MTWQPGQIFESETRRFKLRSLIPADITPDYISWWNDAEIQAGLGATPRGWGKEHVLKNLATFDNYNKFHLGIYQKTDNRLVGFFTLLMDHTHKVSTVNFCLGEKALWGTGVLIEIKVHLMDFMFNTLVAEKLESKIYGRNLPSIFNNKAMGFVSEGILIKHQNQQGGGRRDVFLFGLTKEEWLALKKAGKGAYQ